MDAVGHFIVIDALTQSMQSDQCTGSIVTVRHGTGKIAPAPTAGLCSGIRMTHGGCIPTDDLRHSLFIGKIITKRFDAERRHPIRQIGIDRPGSIFANGRLQEGHRFLRHGMIAQSGTSQAERHESRQGSSLEESAVIRL